MFQLENPWYDIVLRAIIVFVFLFIVFRFWGKKHFAKLTVFDFVLLLIISEGVQNSLSSNDKSVTASMITIGTLVGLNAFLNRITFRFPKLEKIVDGTAEVIISHGKIDYDIMNKEKISTSELEEALRVEGIMDIKKIKLATLENNGKITVIRED